VLVSIDTLRADMLGCYGYARPTSPALDALAARGVLFERAFSPAPWTLPAHTSLLTGLQPSRHGVVSHGVALAAGIPTLAEVLEARGFFTAGIVNSHNLGDRYGLHRGYASYDYVLEQERRVAPSQVEALALRWLERDPPEPFFLFLHFYDVHSDYRALPRYGRLFARAYDGPVDGSTQQLRRVRRGELELGPGAAGRLADLYAAGIRQMDDGLARLLASLDEHGLLDDTLLVVTSDHGEEFLEHGGVLHGRTQFDEVLRVPLVLSGPGLPRGRRVSEPVSLIDVLPTVLALLGVPAPEDLDGLDLRPLWTGGASAALRDRAFFGEADHGNQPDDRTRSVRRGRFKLILDRPTGESRLYDLVADPRETRDVSAEHPVEAAALRRELDDHLERTTPRTPPVPLPDLERDDVERLRALGYL
jgi:arylsulfatase